MSASGTGDIDTLVNLPVGAQATFTVSEQYRPVRWSIEEYCGRDPASGHYGSGAL